MEKFKTPAQLATFLQKHKENLVIKAYEIYRKSKCIHEEIKKRNVE